MSRAIIALILCLLLPSIAQAERRVALVIGNSAYRHTPTLANPRNDATDMAAALKKLSFQVIDGFDLDKASFDRKVREFADMLSGAKAGVFFYAGHGLQVAGVNYLVPVDAKLSTASALDWEMVRLDLVQRTMERETETNVLFLDACRDNPLARNLARAMGTRSAEIGRGLAATEAGLGTLVSFSTQPGNVALDGVGRNSPFADALVKRVAVFTDDLSALLIDVRNDVRRATHNKQVPWEHSALTGRFYFRPPAQPTPAPVFTPGVTDAAREWSHVDRTSMVELETFVRRHGSSPEAEYARARIDNLKRRLAEAAPPRVSTPAIGPSKPVETAAAVRPTKSLSAGCDGVELSVANEKRCLKPRESFKDCPECPQMVVVPAGSFTMGSSDANSDEKPPHRVIVAKPFAAAKYEVTFAEWEACVAEKVCPDASDEGWGRGRRPAINVTWREAREYTAWLTTKTGRTYRLLSEADWEYAARAGTSTKYAFGDGLSPDQAHYSESRQSRASRTVEVGSFQPNGFGLHDMHGNVSEWVADNFHPNYDNAPRDGSSWAGGDPSVSIIRGGSWNDEADALRSAYRARFGTAGSSPFVGFRVARTLD